MLQQEKADQEPRRWLAEIVTSVPSDEAISL